MKFWNDAEVLTFMAMCVRMKLKKDQKALPTTDEKILQRIEQGEKALRGLYQQIKELG